ncbi:MAG: hypothetical protein ACOCQV_03215 [Halolamina sp.]
MSDEDHDVDVQVGTGLETADDEQDVTEEADSEKTDPETIDDEPGGTDAESEFREAEAEAQENVDDHRDEEPHSS